MIFMKNMKHQNYKTTLQFNAATALAQSLERSGLLKKFRAIEAVRAGILAHLIKENLAHGDFEKWVAENVSLTHFKIRTVQRFMRIANQFREDCALTAAKIAASDYISGDITQDAAGEDAIYQAIEGWAAGRSLYRLYEDYGVVKAEKDGGAHHARVTNPEDAQQQEFEQMCASFTSAINQFGTFAMTPGSFGKLPTALRFQCCATLLPALSALTENTEDFTPAQVKQLEEMSQTLRARVIELKNSSRAA